MSTAADRGALRKPTAKVGARGRLFRKYVTLFAAVVAIALIANGLIEAGFFLPRTTIFTGSHAATAGRSSRDED